MSEKKFIIKKLGIILFYLITIIVISLPSFSQNMQEEEFLMFKQIGEDNFKKGNLNKSIEAYKKYLIYFPEDDNVLAELGLIYYELDRFSLAKTTLNDALKLNDMNYFALIGLGKISILEQDYKKADEYYNLAISINPNDEWIYHELGISYFRVNDYKMANEMYFIANKLNNNDSKLKTELGWSYYELKDYKRSLKTFYDALQINSKNDKAYAGLGASLDKLNKTELAIAQFKKSTKINPDQKLAFYRLGRIYFNQDNLEKSQEMLKIAISLSKSVVDKSDEKNKRSLKSSYEVLALSMIKQKKFGEALENLKSSRDIESSLIDLDYKVLTDEQLENLIIQLTKYKNDK